MTRSVRGVDGDGPDGLCVAPKLIGLRVLGGDKVGVMQPVPRRKIGLEMDRVPSAPPAVPLEATTI